MARKEVKKIRGVYEKDPGSGIWWICYKQGNTRKREKAGSRGNAIALYQKRKTELLAGKKLPVNLRKAEITFQELADEAVGWSAEFHPKDIRTVRSRMRLVLAKFGDVPAEKIEPLDIGNWLSSNTQWAPATKNRYRALISLVYRQAMRNGRASRNPARLVAARAENNGGTRYLLDEEERELRKVMARRFPYYLDALIVALNTGMRKGEQFSLTWNAIDLQARKIRLTETKNGSSRTIPINTPCLEALTRLKTTSRAKSDSVFMLLTGTPMKDPRSWFVEALKEARIEDLRWHDLRHTFCSRLAMAGVDIRTIAALAGHKTLQMSMRYAHLAPAHNLSAIEKLKEVA